MNAYSLAVGMAIAAAVVMIAAWVPWRTVLPAWVNETHWHALAIIAGVIVAVPHAAATFAAVLVIVIITVVLNGKVAKLIGQNTAARSRRILDEETANS